MKKYLPKMVISIQKTTSSWADDRSDATERSGLDSKEKYPVSIMVALGATWFGLTRPDCFFNKDNISMVKLNHDKLLPFYQNEGNELFGHKNWWFQQDGGSSHTDQKVEQWCRKNFKLFIPKDR